MTSKMRHRNSTVVSEISKINMLFSHISHTPKLPIQVFLLQRSHRSMYYFNWFRTILNCYIKEIQNIFWQLGQIGNYIYIVDLFDRNGCFRPLDEFMIIEDKSNLLCEYKILLLATKSIRKIIFNVGFLSFQMKCKHIVVGFYSKENDKIKT